MEEDEEKEEKKKKEGCRMVSISISSSNNNRGKTRRICIIRKSEIKEDKYGVENEAEKKKETGRKRMTMQEEKLEKTLQRVHFKLN